MGKSTISMAIFNVVSCLYPPWPVTTLQWLWGSCGENLGDPCKPIDQWPLNKSMSIYYIYCSMCVYIYRYNIGLSHLSGLSHVFLWCGYNPFVPHPGIQSQLHFHIQTGFQTCCLEQPARPQGSWKQLSWHLSIISRWGMQSLIEMSWNL